MARAPNFKDEIGNTYGTLTVVEYIGVSGIGHSTWKCTCDCGGMHTATGTALREGKCLHCKECRGRYVSERKTIHGHSYGRNFEGTPTYLSWVAMKSRCYKEKDINYKNYGGRGIKVCDRWLERKGLGFVNFLEDMGERPEGLTLDRIDVNGNYEPENCKWSTRTEQSRNKQNTRRFMFRGNLLTMKEISEIIDRSYHTVYDNLVTRKVSIESFEERFKEKL